MNHKIDYILIGVWTTFLGLALQYYNPLEPRNLQGVDFLVLSIGGASIHLLVRFMMNSNNKRKNRPK